MGKKKSSTQKVSEVQKYLKLTIENKALYGEKTIVFYQLGTFFEVYGLRDPITKKITGSYIEEFGRICGMQVGTRANIKMIDGKDVVIAGEPLHGNPERKIKQLIKAQFTVVGYEQDPNVPSIRTKAWVRGPGTELDMEDNIISNNTMCIWLNKRDKTMLNKKPFIVCGMSCVDVCTGAVHLFEYKRDLIKRHSSTIFDSLERFNTIHNPSEIIIIHNYDDEKEIQEIIQIAQLDCIKFHIHNIDDTTNSNHSKIQNSSQQVYQQEILERFYEIYDFSSFNETHQLQYHPMATQSFCFLLDFIYEHNANLVKNIQEPYIENVDEKLLLANHSLQQLHIINNGEVKGNLSSVLNLLNKTKTPMGSRKFKMNLLHPITDSTLLNKEYDIVEYIYNNWEKFLSIRENFNQFRDLEKLYRKIVLNKVSPYELVKFYENMELVLELNTILSKDENISEYLEDKIEAIQELDSNCRSLRKQLENKLAIDIAATINNIMIFDTNFFIKGVYDELDTVEETINVNSTNLEEIRQFFNDCLKFDVGI